MPFLQEDSIRYFVFDSLRDHNINHGIFTRKGGVSPPPWDSLNVGGTVGDDPKRVLNNRDRIFRTLGLGNRSSYDVWQVHSNKVVCARAPRETQTKIKKADAILTNVPGVTLFMRFADCVPIFFYDPNKSVIGIAHAGWKGTLGNIVQETLLAMQENYGSKPKDIISAIGPSIAAHHYEIGPDVLELIEDRYGTVADNFLIKEENDGVDEKIRKKPMFDLQKANQYHLLMAGVRIVEISWICTACNLVDWFSHRGENGKTGRFGALVTL
jgi:YfiH family protein